MVNIKIINELNYDEVNYNEIEEVDEITLYDSLEGWIDETDYLETEDELFNMIDEEEEVNNKAIDIMAEHLKEWYLLNSDMTITDILSQDHNPVILEIRKRIINERPES